MTPWSPWLENFDVTTTPRLIALEEEKKKEQKIAFGNQTPPSSKQLKLFSKDNPIKVSRYHEDICLQDAIEQGRGTCGATTLLWV